MLCTSVMPAARTAGRCYLRYLNAEFRNPIPGVGIQIGRMPYSSGAEASSGNPTIEVVKQQRVAARLVGEFEWSLFQRAYDGLRIDTVRQPWSASFVALRPTQGGFEDAAGLMMKRRHAAGRKRHAQARHVAPRHGTATLCVSL